MGGEWADGLGCGHEEEQGRQPQVVIAAQAPAPQLRQAQHARCPARCAARFAVHGQALGRRQPEGPAGESDGDQGPQHAVGPAHVGLPFPGLTFGERGVVGAQRGHERQKGGTVELEQALEQVVGGALAAAGRGTQQALRGGEWAQPELPRVLVLLRVLGGGRVDDLDEEARGGAGQGGGAGDRAQQVGQQRGAVLQDGRAAQAGQQRTQALVAAAPADGGRGRGGGTAGVRMSVVREGTSESNNRIARPLGNGKWGMSDLLEECRPSVSTRSCRRCPSASPVTRGGWASMPCSSRR